MPATVGYGLLARWLGGVRASGVLSVPSTGGVTTAGQASLIIGVIGGTGTSVSGLVTVVSTHIITGSGGAVTSGGNLATIRVSGTGGVYLPTQTGAFDDAFSNAFDLARQIALVTIRIPASGGVSAQSVVALAARVVGSGGVSAQSSAAISEDETGAGGVATFGKILLTIRIPSLGGALGGGSGTIRSTQVATSMGGAVAGSTCAIITRVGGLGGISTSQGAFDNAFSDAFDSVHQVALVSVTVPAFGGAIISGIAQAISTQIVSGSGAGGLAGSASVVTTVSMIGGVATSGAVLAATAARPSVGVTASGISGITTIVVGTGGSSTTGVTPTLTAYHVTTSGAAEISGTAATVHSGYEGIIYNDNFSGGSMLAGSAIVSLRDEIRGQATVSGSDLVSTTITAGHGAVTSGIAIISATIRMASSGAGTISGNILTTVSVSAFGGGIIGGAAYPAAGFIASGGVSVNGAAFGGVLRSVAASGGVGASGRSSIVLRVIAGGSVVASSTMPAVIGELVAPSSIESGEAHGTPIIIRGMSAAGIASGEAFGADVIIRYIGAASAQDESSVGTPSLYPGIIGSSILSEEEFGTPVVIKGTKPVPPEEQGQVIPYVGLGGGAVAIGPIEKKQKKITITFSFNGKDSIHTQEISTIDITLDQLTMGEDNKPTVTLASLVKT